MSPPVLFTTHTSLHNSVRPIQFLRTFLLNLFHLLVAPSVPFGFHFTRLSGFEHDRALRIDSH